MYYRCVGIYMILKYNIEYSYKMSVKIWALKQRNAFINVLHNILIFMYFCHIGESGIVGQHKFPAPRWPYTQSVKFTSPFEEKPTVTYGLYLLDFYHNTNLRFDSAVTAVTKTGFQVTFRTWADTLLYGARISWMACGK